jgi:hypothetical protein
VILKDTLLALLYIFECFMIYCINTSDKELLLVVTVHKVPHIRVIDFCDCIFFCLKFIDLRDSSS